MNYWALTEDSHGIYKDLQELTEASQGTHRGLVTDPQRNHGELTQDPRSTQRCCRGLKMWVSKALVTKLTPSTRCHNWRINPYAHHVLGFAKRLETQAQNFCPTAKPGMRRNTLHLTWTRSFASSACTHAARKDKNNNETRLIFWSTVAPRFPLSRRSALCCHALHFLNLWLEPLV